MPNIALLLLLAMLKVKHGESLIEVQKMNEMRRNDD